MAERSNMNEVIKTKEGVTLLEGIGMNSCLFCY